MTEAIALTSFGDFIDGEARSERRHDLVGGRVYAMAGGTERHDLAAGLGYELLATGARTKGCLPFTANRLVRTRSGNAYYPDVMVACGPAPHRLYETDPALVVEMLSPSTADVDRREKAVAYAEADSLQLLVLVDPGVRWIELARPNHGVIDAWKSADLVMCWRPHLAMSMSTPFTTSSTARPLRPDERASAGEPGCGPPPSPAVEKGRTETAATPLA